MLMPRPPRAVLLPILVAPFLASPILSTGLAQADLLAGPRVKESAPPELRDSMASNAGAMGQLRLNDREYRALFESLRSEDAPDGVRPSAAQQTQIEALLASYQSERQAYFREHRDELARLRREAGEGARRGSDRARPDADSDRPSPMTDDDMSGQAERKNQDLARARLRELRAGAPTTASLFREMWELLEPVQQTYLESKLDEMRAERNAEREAEYVRRRIEAQQSQGDARRVAPNDAPMTDRARPNDNTNNNRDNTNNNRRARLLALFNRLSPEQQETLISRLEERIRSDAPSTPDAGQRARTSRPRPTVDRVRVPKPDTP